MANQNRTLVRVLTAAAICCWGIGVFMIFLGLAEGSSGEGWGIMAPYVALTLGLALLGALLAVAAWATGRPKPESR